EQSADRSRTELLRKDHVALLIHRPRVASGVSPDVEGGILPPGSGSPSKNRPGRASVPPVRHSSFVIHQWLTLFFWLLLGGTLNAELPPASRSLEYKVKAAYLFNFTKYLEWPQEALPSQES